ncbi:MAG: DUF1501 domain-containing protein [Planctomycetes bacterium]|nr:DUF1501 domain-containing protein [Planctomycetota bacterium]
MDPREEARRLWTRRALLGVGLHGIGRVALGALLLESAARAQGGAVQRAAAGGGAVPLAGAGSRGLPGLPHFAPRAKRVICLFQSGGMSHVDLFDGKPALEQFAGQELPPSVKGTQRITGMTSGQANFPVVAPIAPGRRCGASGRWMSDLLPHLQTVADQLCVVKSVETDAINHDPAITFFNTGNQLPGYASMGAWASYGLGSECADLPAFVVLVSQGSGKNPGQPIFSRLWGSGFLPSSHQGVGLRSGGDPVLHLDNPAGVSREQRRAQLDELAELNALHAAASGDPETTARIAAYEMAFRMQASVPSLADTSDETAATLERYGPDVRRPGSYAAHCLLARRMVERGVRFVQLFHRGWDQHIAIRRQLPNQCRDIDQPTAALLKDLEARGLLEDTLVCFFTEFGRTVFSQGNPQDPSAGRDHHGRCFTVWMAGGGLRPGIEHGATDDFSYNVVADPVPVRDLHATLLHCLGVDHERLTFPFRGLDAKLTGVEEAKVVKELLA